MSNEKREQQMMDAADRYADEVCDESCTGAQVAETINDFCAGWRAADSHPHWISVEEKLPEECELVYAIREGNVEPGIYKFMAKDQWEWAPRFIACLDDITHWMPLPKPPRKEEK